MSENSVNNPQILSEQECRSACYVFNEKTETFADTMRYLGKFSDSMLVEFGDGRLYIEAITPSKSAYASATFEGSSIAEWEYGDLQSIVDKRIQLSTKQLIGSLRFVTKSDTLHFFITGISCDKVVIQYTNSKDIMRTYDLQAREMSVHYNKSNYNPEQYSNKIECNVLFFKNIFAQLSDNDEMRFQFYPDYSVITKFVDPSHEATSSTLHSMQAAESYDRYEIAVPMSMIVSVKELKVSLKLIGVHSYMASVHFDLGKKPLLITFNDDEKDEQCKVLLAVADVHAITEEEQEERQSESAATQSINNSHRRSQRSHNGYTADDRSDQQEDEDEPPLKQRKISKAFSFERDSDDESEPHDPRIITPNSNSGNHNYVPLNETPSENQDQYVQPVNNSFSGDNNDSFNNDADFQHPDFDDIPAAPSPSDLPPQREERNSTSPYCLALRMLGIEDQISDIEAPDVLETYDIETTDPNEDLYILSQIPR